jgi:hypothetical protein
VVQVNDTAWWLRRTRACPQMRDEVDPSRPNAARIYDYMLGGKDNFAVDRQVVDQMLAVLPDVLTGPRALRGCLRRAVRHMAGQAGIDQFIDLGSGLPTEDNVHQVAQRHDAGARVVYVDVDPVAAVHGAALLVTDASTAFVPADIRDVGGVLRHPDVRRLIDLDRPVGLIMCAVLNYVLDEEDPWEMVAAYSDAMPAGSHLFLTQICRTGDPANEEIGRIFEGFGAQLRSPGQVAEFFTGWTLVEPGIVPAIAWRPDLPVQVPPSHEALLAGLAVK